MGEIILSEGHGCLSGAFRAAASNHFPASGKMPPAAFFSAPQYNTWIELNHNQSEAGVLQYARGILENNLPPGILMIDAMWSDYFGHFDFHAGRFPTPKKMMGQLREWGFQVMLWVSPLISLTVKNIGRCVIARAGFLETRRPSRHSGMVGWL